MPSDSFYRCYKALHHVTYEAIPCVEDSLKTWHTNQQQTLSPCTVQCPAGKKPKPPMSCSNCVKWAKAIETVYYQPTSGTKPPPQKTQKQINWQNVHSSGFFRTYVEVAKAFVLRLPKMPAEATQSTQQIQQQATGSTQAVSSSSTTVAISSSAAASSGSASSSSTALGTSGSAATAAFISVSSIPSSTPSVTKQYTKISDFDAACLLMIMAHFSEFHKRDQEAYELIEKISAIRNSLSHMALDCNMQVEAKTVTEIFTTLEDFVNRLAKIYPHHLRSKDVITRLKEIQSEPVTDKMKEDILQDLCKEFKLMKDEVQELSKTQLHVQEAVLDVTRSLEKLRKKNEIPFDVEHCREQLMSDYRESRGKLPLFPGMPEEFEDMDQLYVNLELVETRKVKVLASYEELFTQKDKDKKPAKRVLIKGGPGGGKTTLVSKIAYEWSFEQKARCLQERIADFFSHFPYSSSSLRTFFHLFLFCLHIYPLFYFPLAFFSFFLFFSLFRILFLRVEKSSTRESPGRLSECKLLFVLNLRDVRPGMSVIDAVHDQYLPFVSSQGLFDYITANASSVIFLLDGYDEASWIGSKSDKSTQPDQFLKLLQNKWLQDSHVIVTTRPHRVSTYVDNFGICTLVQLREMSESQITKYVAKFFNIPPGEYLGLANRLVWLPLDRKDPPIHVEEALAEANSMLSACVSGKAKERCIAHIPILLTMLCVLWKQQKSLPCKLTDVFDQALFYLAKHNWVKNQTSDELNDESLERDLQETLHRIGEIALNNLLKDDLEGQLVFNDSEFHSQPGLLDKAVMLGIVTKERGRSKAKCFRTQHNISFLHKTFQEFCAAKYLATIEQLGKFEMCLEKITPSNFSDLNYMVQFCCGLSTKAAKYILPHIVRVLKPTRIHNFTGRVTLDCSIGASGNLWTPALLLLHESQSPTLHSTLQPLFEIRSITLTLGNHAELLAALYYFVDCRIGASTQADKHLDAISDVNVNIAELSDKYDKHIQVCSKFLECTTNLQILTVRLPLMIASASAMNQSFHPMTDLQTFTRLILQGDLNALIKCLSKKKTGCKNLTDLNIIFDIPSASFISGLHELRKLYRRNKPGIDVEANRNDLPVAIHHSYSETDSDGFLQSLKQLTVSGTNDFFTVRFNAHESSCFNLRSLVISCTVCDISPMKRFLSQLVNLRNVSLRRKITKDHKRVSAGQLLNCLSAKKVRSICISHYYVPAKSLRPLLPKLLTLHCENLDGAASKELLSVLYETSRKRFSEFRSGRSQSPLQCKHLRLHHLSVTSVRLLAKTFRYMPRLAVLNLSESGISEANFKIIAIALPTLKSLIELNFSNNSVEEASALVAKSIAKLPRLEKLLMRRFFNDEGMRELSSSLHHLPKLKLLKLSKNPASSAMLEISLALRKLQYIEELNLRNTGLSDGGLACLPFQHMPNLTFVDIGGESHAKILRRLENRNAGKLDLDDLINRNPGIFFSNEQMYTSEGLRAVFANLHHLKKLTCLKIMYDANWVKDNAFWQLCYKQCLSDCIAEDDTLTLERKQIEAVSDFVRNGSSQ